MMDICAQLAPFSRPELQPREDYQGNGLGRAIVERSKCTNPLEMMILMCSSKTDLRSRVQRRDPMPVPKANENEISRDRLAELLNEDLSREYQAIIAYVVYSQVLKGAQYMDIAAQLEIHAKQELDHALILSRQIDYLGKMPVVTPKSVRTSKDAKEMLRYDLDNENETIRNYRDRIPQCETLGEYAMAEQIRQILTQEQDHQIDLATALGEEVPDVGGGPRRRNARMGR
jgi:bacterioferritin